eukprot:m51a1_g8942 hypothetical protein (4167) ;mRNA; r:947139-967770
MPLRHMRAHVLAALLVLVGVAIGISVAVFRYTSEAQLRTLERGQALEEATLLHGVLDSQLATIKSDISGVANWDDAYDYLIKGDPTGGIWWLVSRGLDFLEVLDLEAMLNGFMWGANRTYGAEKDTASSELARQVGAALVRDGEASGLFWIPESGTPVLVGSLFCRKSDTTGDNVGWIVYARKVQSPLRKIAEMTSLCIQFLTDTSNCPGLRKAWSGRPVRMKSTLAADSVSFTVAQSSAFEGVQLACAGVANKTADTYLAIGAVLSDEAGVPRLSLLIRGLRNDSHTIGPATRFMTVICCAALVAILCMVALLMEAFVLRTLSRLSGRIGDVSKNNTENILRSIYPTEVLGRIKRGESNNLTFPATCILFVDICNFTLWSSALTPDIVTKYLNELFSCMDDIANSEGATKIMTIGDAYVAATGFEESSSTNCAQTMATVALRFARLCHGNIMAASEQPLLFRMGIASGSCSSAMIGLRKRFYELWGPSVTLSQKIQESASPGEILVCSETKRALEDTSRGHFAFEPAEGAAQGTAWRLVSTGDTPDIGSLSPTSLPSPGLLSILEDDSTIVYPADENEGACTRLVRSLRLGVVLGATALLAVSLGALVAFLLTTLSTTTNELVQTRAMADTTRASHTLREALNELTMDASGFGNWDVAVDYVTKGDPNGYLWQLIMTDRTTFNAHNIEGVLYFTRNGTLVNSCGYNYATHTSRNISALEISVLARQLLKGGVAWSDTTTGQVLARLAASFPVRYEVSSEVVGWVVFIRDIARLLPAKAQMMHMCLGTLYSRDSTPGPLQDLWNSGRAIAIGSDINKLLAEERRLFTLLCWVGVAILVFVLAGSVGLMELLVFRGLSRLSGAIIAVTSKTGRAAVRFRGNDQLLRIAHSVNRLLACRDAQHQKSVELIQSLFPPHVFEVLQKGELPNESYKSTYNASACMAALGVPSETEKHAHTMLKMALEFHRVSQGMALPGRNWVYDLWSDTVNMARIASHSPAPHPLPDITADDACSSPAVQAARLKAKAQVGTAERAAQQLARAGVADARAAERLRALAARWPGCLDAPDPLGRTPLALCLLSGHTDLLRLLLGAGHACPRVRATPLYAAALMGDGDAATALLEAGAAPDGTYGDNACETALAAAAQRGHLAVALLSAGADVHERSNAGSTALLECCCHAPAADAPAVAALLLAAGAKPDDCGARADPNAADASGRTALLDACRWGCAEAVGALLVGGARALASSCALCPLCEAARFGNADAVRLLLPRAAGAEHRHAVVAEAAEGCALGRAGAADAVRELLASGAAVDAEREADGSTALIVASGCGDAKLVDVLLTAGANASRKRRDGLTALQAARAGRHAAVERMLLDALAGTSATSAGPSAEAAPFEFRTAVGGQTVAFGHPDALVDSRGTTLLVHVLLAGGSAADVRALADAGADVDKRCCGCLTPLIAACAAGPLDRVRVLLDAGADASLPAEDGVATPLVAALLGARADAVTLLLSSGADATWADAAGRSAAWWAAVLGRHELLGDLARCGASTEQCVGGRTLLTEVCAREGRVEDLGQTALCQTLGLRVVPGEATATLAVLAKMGCDVGKSDSKDETPLGVAIRCRHTEVVRVLLSVAASLDIQNIQASFTFRVTIERSGRSEVVTLTHPDDSVDDAGTTLLVYLLVCGSDAKVVQTVLDACASVGKQCGCSLTPLIAASMSGNLECVALLLSRGAAVAQASLDGRTTPLIAAVVGGHRGVVELLLSREPEANQLGALAKPMAWWAAAYGRLDLLDFLLRLRGEQTASLAASLLFDLCEDATPSTSVDWAEFGRLGVRVPPLDASAAVGTLLALGAQADQQRASDGATPLLLACLSGSARLVEALLSRGADLQRDGARALQGARDRGHAAVVRLLEAALPRPAPPRDFTFEVVTIGTGGERTTTTLRDPDGEVGTSGLTLLVYLLLSRAATPEAVRALLGAGASVGKPSGGSMTPLVAACLAGALQSVELLLAAKADPNQPSADGRMVPLSAAVVGGDVRVVRLLLAAGAEPSRLDGLGRSSVWWAAKFGRAEILELLVGAGAPSPPPHSGTPGLRSPVLEACATRAGEAAGMQETLEYRRLGGAIAEGDRAMVVSVLIRLGVAVDLGAAIALAARSGNAGIVRQLIEAGAPVDAALLEEARKSGSAEVVDVLIKVVQKSQPQPQQPQQQQQQQQQKAEALQPEGQGSQTRSFTFRVTVQNGDKSETRTLSHPDEAVDAAGTSLVVFLLASGQVTPQVVEQMLQAGASVDRRCRATLTPLIAACAAGNPEAVRLLLERKADPCLPSADGRVTPLVAAVASGSTEVLRALIAAGCGVAAAVDASGRPPAWWAARYARAEALELLLDNGAAAPSSLLFAAIGAAAVGEPELQELAELGCVFTPGPRAAVIDLLVRRGADVNGSLGGETPLGAAFRTRDLTVVDVLLRLGANPNGPSEGGNGPLWAAASAGLVDITATLVRAGASAERELMRACAEGDLVVLGTLLAAGVPLADAPGLVVQAAQRGRADVVAWLLQHGADASQPSSDGTAPLLAAVGAGHLDVVLALLAAGAPVVTPRPSDGMTALLAATASARVDIIEVLVRHGASPCAAAPGCPSPLGAACAAGNALVVRLFIRLGADLSGAGGAAAQQPLVAAIAAGHREVVEILIRAGAPVGPEAAKAASASGDSAIAELVQGAAAAAAGEDEGERREAQRGPQALASPHALPHIEPPKEVGSPSSGPLSSSRRSSAKLPPLESPKMPVIPVDDGDAADVSPEELESPPEAEAPLEDDADDAPDEEGTEHGDEGTQQPEGAPGNARRAAAGRAAPARRPPARLRPISAVPRGPGFRPQRQSAGNRPAQGPQRLPRPPPSRPQSAVRPPALGQRARSARPVSAVPQPKAAAPAPAPEQPSDKEAKSLRWVAVPRDGALPRNAVVAGQSARSNGDLCAVYLARSCGAPAVVPGGCAQGSPPPTDGVRVGVPLRGAVAEAAEFEVLVATAGAKCCWEWVDPARQKRLPGQPHGHDGHNLPLWAARVEAGPRGTCIGWASNNFAGIKYVAGDEVVHETGRGFEVLHTEEESDGVVPKSRKHLVLAPTVLHREPYPPVTFTDTECPRGPWMLWADPSIPASTEDVAHPHVWRRASEVSPGATLWGQEPGEPEPAELRLDTSEIDQGGLGTCYLLGPLASLTARPDLIRRMFVAHDVAVGIYAIAFYLNLQWRWVVVDDYIPCNALGHPLYAFCKKKRKLWNINGGVEAYAMVDLLGTASTRVDVAGADPEALWRRLSAWLGAGDVLSCSIAPAEPGAPPRDDRGLLAGHSHCVARAVDAGGTRLVEVFNPHGSQAWAGRWSAGDEATWAAAGDAVRAQCPRRGGGFFWMEWPDFCARWTALNVGLVPRDSWSSATTWGFWDFGESEREDLCGGEAQWHRNPQYALELGADSTVVVCLAQPAAKAYDGSDDYYFGIGVAICAAGSDGDGDDVDWRVDAADDRCVVARCPASVERSVSLVAEMPARRRPYAVVVYTDRPGVVAPFALRVHSSAAFRLHDPLPRTAVVAGIEGSHAAPEFADLFDEWFHTLRPALAAGAQQREGGTVAAVFGRSGSERVVFGRRTTERVVFAHNNRYEQILGALESSRQLLLAQGPGGDVPGALRRLEEAKRALSEPHHKVCVDMTSQRWREVHLSLVKDVGESPDAQKKVVARPGKKLFNASLEDLWKFVDKVLIARAMARELLVLEAAGAWAPLTDFAQLFRAVAAGPLSIRAVAALPARPVVQLGKGSCIVPTLSAHARRVTVKEVAADGSVAKTKTFLFTSPRTERVGVAISGVRVGCGLAFSACGHNDFGFGVESGELRLDASKVVSLVCSREVGTCASAVVSMVYDRTPSQVYCACRGDRDIWMWNIGRARSALKLSGHQAPISALVSSGDGNMFSGSEDGTVIQWDIVKETQLRSFAGVASGIVSLFPTGDGFLILSSADGAVRALNVGSRSADELSEVDTFARPATAINYCQPSRLLVALPSGVVNAYVVNRRKAPTQPRVALTRRSACVTAMCSKNRLFCATEAGSVACIDVARGDCVWERQVHRARVTGMVMSSRLVTVAADGALALVNPANGTVGALLDLAQGPLSSLQASTSSVVVVGAESGAVVELNLPLETNQQESWTLSMTTQQQQ